MLNRIKAAYVSLYLTFATIVSGYAIWQWQQGGDLMSWSGVFLAAAPMAALIGFIMIKPVVARTSPNLIEIHIPILVGLTLATRGYSTGAAGLEVLILSLISWGAFMLYAFWYSHYDRKKSQALEIGKTLPDFRLLDVQNQSKASHEISSGQPTIFMFYRGNWCPLCMAQIKEVAAKYKELEALGAKVVLVSPQPHSYTTDLAKKFDVNFDFMTDQNNQAAKALNILSDFGIPTGIEALGYETEAPMPTVFITNKEGKVVWAHETDNYRVRPEPETFLQVIKEM